MRIALLVIIGIHGLIHLLGFVKAFDLANLKELTLPISKTVGIIWGISFLLFAILVYLYASKNSNWWMLAFFAVLISQILIIYFWQNAKFGTVANLIILLAAIVGYANWDFENTYQNEVNEGLLKSNQLTEEILNSKDLEHLPAPVQKYLNYVGVVNKPKVKNVKITFDGEMRGKNQDWFKFTSEQYNFMDEPTRLFFMKAKIKRLTTNGFHIYKKENAGMFIKLLSLFSVVSQEGKDLFKAETVTFFNDLCLFAPAALIDSRIKWEAINAISSKAFFTNKGVTISAILHFNEKGQLINFISDDRFDITDKEQVRFSTPTFDYQNINGYNLCKGGEAIWHYPEGEFIYGKFHVTNIAYNVREKDLD